ncbi:hypothetical protein G7Y89_g4466 [Cudoniella acicularis]|uniref:Uncharacterized protein n=1 Tax=Cudoniella acicularis TaxID=354080 RepID=A0A8H4RPE2_9HELO|nr:hypothetical protein G7Y89_g4466 [Cudoniella acicularis]
MAPTLSELLKRDEYVVYYRRQPSLAAIIVSASISVIILIICIILCVRRSSHRRAARQGTRIINAGNNNYEQVQPLGAPQPYGGDFPRPMDVHYGAPVPGAYIPPPQNSGFVPPPYQEKVQQHQQQQQQPLMQSYANAPMHGEAAEYYRHQ